MLHFQDYFVVVFFKPSALFQCVAATITYVSYSSTISIKEKEAVFLLCADRGENRAGTRAKESSYVFHSHAAPGSSRQTFLCRWALWEPSPIPEMIGSSAWRVCVRKTSRATMADAPARSCYILPPTPKKLHFNVFFCFKLIISWPF